MLIALAPVFTELLLVGAVLASSWSVMVGPDEEALIPSAQHDVAFYLGWSGIGVAFVTQIVLVLAVCATPAR